MHTHSSQLSCANTAVPRSLVVSTLGGNRGCRNSSPDVFRTRSCVRAAQNSYSLACFAYCQEVLLYVLAFPAHLIGPSKLLEYKAIRVMSSYQTYELAILFLSIFF